jgi:hypothetical protein
MHQQQSDVLILVLYDFIVQSILFGPITTQSEMNSLHVWSK